jgi:hypothetical protein
MPKNEPTPQESKQGTESRRDSHGAQAPTAIGEASTLPLPTGGEPRPSRIITWEDFREAVQRRRENLKRIRRLNRELHRLRRHLRSSRREETATEIHSRIEQISGEISRICSQYRCLPGPKCRLERAIERSQRLLDVSPLRARTRHSGPTRAIVSRAPRPANSRSAGAVASSSAAPQAGSATSGDSASSRAAPGDDGPSGDGDPPPALTDSVSVPGLPGKKSTKLRSGSAELPPQALPCPDPTQPDSQLSADQQQGIDLLLEALVELWVEEALAADVSPAQRAEKGARHETH